MTVTDDVDKDFEDLLQRVRELKIRLERLQVLVSQIFARSGGPNEGKAAPSRLASSSEIGVTPGVDLPPGNRGSGEDQS